MSDETMGTYEDVNFFKFTASEDLDSWRPKTTDVKKGTKDHWPT